MTGKDSDKGGSPKARKNLRSFTAPKEYFEELETSHESQEDPFAAYQRPKIADREDDYRKRGRERILSPDRIDPFASSSKEASSHSQRSYSEVMLETNLEKEKQEVIRKIERKIEEEKYAPHNQTTSTTLNPPASTPVVSGPSKPARKRRWDQATPKEGSVTPNLTPNLAANLTPNLTANLTANSTSAWDQVEETLSSLSDTKWGETPIRKKNRWDATPESGSQT
eukprot:Sdes_comp17042_c0_seq1m6240